MASFFLHHCPFLLFLTFFSLCFSVSPSQSAQTGPIFRPNSLALPVRKDPATGLHVANVSKRTPPLQVPLAIDLNGRFLWANCESGSYLSSTYNAPLCHSTQCSQAVGPNHYCRTCSSRARPGCHNDTCGVTVTNPVTGRSAIGELAQDSLSVRSAQGSRQGQGPIARVRQFLFVCAPSALLQPGLPRKAQGVVGLGHSHESLPSQLASHFGFQQKFATCLPRGNGNGAVFFGDGTYFFPPGIDVTRRLTYTPLTISQDGEYAINLSGIKINNHPVGTPVSRAIITTTNPYTFLDHSLFVALTNVFANQLKIPRVQPVAPFGACFDAKGIASTRIGPAVPPVDLFLHDQSTRWRILGANSMIEARPGVMCLAFVDGGARPHGSSMVIGAYQLEDNLVQFDLAKSMLGFSSSLLFRRTSCSNFNFTSSTTSP